MTKTEAIDLLDTLVGMVEDNQESDYDDALKMAIEALRTIEKQQHDGCLNCDHFDVVRQIQWERDTAIQQLKELGYGLGEKIRTDGDPISRQAARNAICDFEKLINASDLVEWIMEAYPDWCVGAIRCIVDHINDMPSAQRKGKWILKPDIYGVAYCSECDFELHINDTPYCPNCGARMEKGEEDETD